MRAAKVQASLRIRAVSPEPSLLAHTSSESRGTFRQKARSLAPLNGWACAVKICHDGMLEDTNSLDGAQLQSLLPKINLNSTMVPIVAKNGKQFSISVNINFLSSSDLTHFKMKCISSSIPALHKAHNLFSRGILLKRPSSINKVLLLIRILTNVLMAFLSISVKRYFSNSETLFRFCRFSICYHWGFLHQYTNCFSRKIYIC